MLHRFTFFCKIFFVSFVFVACSNKKEDEKLFEELNECLENSNKIIEHKSQDCLHKLEEDLQKAVTKDRAGIWIAKAKSVEKLSNDLIAYADYSKSKLINSSSKKIDKKEAKVLFDNLVKYKQQLLLIDERMSKEFENQIKANDSTEFTETAFIESFTSLNPILKLATYKNNIARTEEMLIEYCSLNVGYGCILQFDIFRAIASQNSTHFKPKETLEITAGVGEFSKAANPKISVDKREIKLNSEGVAEYKTRVPNKKGTYKKQLKIEYIKPDGTKGIAEKEIIYTVDE